MTVHSRRRSGPSHWRATRALRRAIATRPALYMPMRRRAKPETVVTPETALLIEGFPRSGNTWTEAVIRQCAPEDIRLAHHSHAAAHVKHAVALGVPVMVLYRAPDAAVRSWLTLYNNHPAARDGYLDYLSFYRETLPLQGKGVLFFSFEDATQRTGAMVAALNAAFGLGLSEAGLDDEAGRAAIFARMDRKAARLKRADGKSDSRPGNSNAEKERQQALARSAIEVPEAQAARRAAAALFDTMVSSLPRAPEPVSRETGQTETGTSGASAP